MQTYFNRLFQNKLFGGKTNIENSSKQISNKLEPNLDEPNFTHLKAKHLHKKLHQLILLCEQQGPISSNLESEIKEVYNDYCIANADLEMDHKRLKTTASERVCQGAVNHFTKLKLLKQSLIEEFIKTDDKKSFIISLSKGFKRITDFLDCNYIPLYKENYHEAMPLTVFKWEWNDVYEWCFSLEFKKGLKTLRIGERIDQLKDEEKIDEAEKIKKALNFIKSSTYYLKKNGICNSEDEQIEEFLSFFVPAGGSNSEIFNFKPLLTWRNGITKDDILMLVGIWKVHACIKTGMAETSETLYEIMGLQNVPKFKPSTIKNYLHEGYKKQKMTTTIDFNRLNSTFGINYSKILNELNSD